MSYHFAEIAAPVGAPLLFVFHGTGGDENNLLQFGAGLVPGAHVISPRGDVSEDGALRFFKRAAEGVYDMADFARAQAKMTSFIRDHIAATNPSSVAALGFSNGANILAGVLFAAPELLDHAVLMHPLIPFDPPPQPALTGRKVLITAGRADPIAPVAQTEALEAYFVSQGADARLAWQEGGHQIRRPEIADVQSFLAG
jgi:phospholipase/carboxylesterase